MGLLCATTIVGRALVPELVGPTRVVEGMSQITGVRFSHNCRSMAGSAPRAQCYSLQIGSIIPSWEAVFLYPGSGGSESESLRRLANPDWTPGGRMGVEADPVVFTP